MLLQTIDDSCKFEINLKILIKILLSHEKKIIFVFPIQLKQKIINQFFEMPTYQPQLQIITMSLRSRQLCKFKIKAKIIQSQYPAAKKVLYYYEICYLQQFQQPMMSIFRSKDQKIICNLLNDNGFNNNDFKQFKIGDVARQVVSKGLLPAFKQIIKEHKMTHLKLLKTTLLVLHMLQISQQIEENPFLEEVIRSLQMRTRTVMHYSRRPINRSLGSIKKSQDKDQEGNYTSKQIYNPNQPQSPQSEQLNSVSYLLCKLVQPLLHIEEKILYSHELIYRPKKQMDSDMCWATINLLKKYAELGRTIEEIGRYYKQYTVAMVCTIRVLSLDIRILYRRVADYLKKQCFDLKIVLESFDVMTIQIEQEQRIKEIILLVQELQIINEYIRLLYCNKYYSEILILNHIYMPPIFRTGEDNLQLLYSFLECKNKISIKQTNTSLSGLLVPPKLNKSDSLQRVENV